MQAFLNQFLPFVAVLVSISMAVWEHRKRHQPKVLCRIEMPRRKTNQTVTRRVEIDVSHLVVPSNLRKRDEDALRNNFI